MERMDEDTPGSQGPSTSGPSTVSSGKQPVTSPAAGATSGSGAPTPVGSAASQQLSKRRRGLGVVTPNACTECRKKRAKCDGNRPCGRCKAQKDVECVYEAPVRHSKENLRNEIDTLRRHRRSSDNVFAALARPELWEEVLHRLRGGENVESISDWLAPGESLPPGGGTLPAFGRPVGAAGPNVSALAGFSGVSGNSYTPMAPGVGTVSSVSGQAQGLRPEDNSSWGGHFSSHSQTQSTRSNSHPDTVSWATGAPQQSRIGSWVENVGQDPSSEAPKYRGLDQVLAPEMPEMKVPAGAWTKITQDSYLVQHLLALYFCWEYPTFASLSKEHFLKDFQDGRQRYCSPILVNALLALGCRFSSQPNTRANPNNPYTSGDHFFKESQVLFYKEDNHHTLTTIQALGIMSIREASCGRDSESWYYAGQSIRLAIEMGLHRISDAGGDEDEVAVQAATFWGAFALDHAWSLATGSLPQSSCFPHLPPKPGIIDDLEAPLWIPYTDDGAPLQRSCEQPSNVRSVYKCFCELSELVHQSLYILHSPGRSLTSRDLLSIYTQYLNWYDKIPEVLRLGHNFTPAVLFAHMYYHFAILLLFRPLIKLRIIGSSITPKDVCAQAADAIQSLLRSYSQLYTLRRTPSFVPYFVLTSSITHLAIGAAASGSLTPDVLKSETMSPTSGPASAPPWNSRMDPRVAESINRGIADLTEMAPCHRFAEQALNILRYLAKKWNIDVEFASMAQPDDYERSVRPLTSSRNFFAPNYMETDFQCNWGPVSGMGTTNTPSAAGPAAVAQAAEGMDNPLFWPFPMQGRPILPSGHLLEEAGFQLL